MQFLYTKIILLNAIIGSFFISVATTEQQPVLEPPSTLVVQKQPLKIHKLDKQTDKIIFKHGDVSWLPALASQAGWPKDTHKRLSEIILRESGGCPNRRGGDIVDKNCNITGVSEWNHRSDTGLLQINGVNYDLERNKWAALCTQIDICTQEILLDPLNNLKAGKLLYDLSGWDPWDPCAWGPKYAHRCKP